MTHDTCDATQRRRRYPTLNSRPPIVIGHRGAAGLRPDHTLEGYALAIEHGADFIEPDLVCTADGVLIARHEPELSHSTDVADRGEFASYRTTRTIDGVTIAGWFACDFTLAEIKRLRARQPFDFRDHSFDGLFQIPTLQEVIDLAQAAGRRSNRAIGIYPETKHPTFFASLNLALEERLARTLHDNGYRSRTDLAFIQSFEVTNLRQLRLLTDLPLVQLTDGPLIGPDGAVTYRAPYDFVASGDPRSYGELLSPEGLAQIATYAQGIGPNKRSLVPVDVNNRLMPPTRLVEGAHAAGLLVHSWTFRNEPRFLAEDYGNDPAKEYEQFYRLGIDGLFTDFPAIAILARSRP